MVRESHQGACSVGDIRYCMEKPLRIHGNVSFDTKYLLTRVIYPSVLRYLYTSRFYINDHEGRLLAPTTVDTDPDLANHIF